MSNEAHEPPKSMRLFFIDNQGAWPTAADGTSKAQLVGDLVVWPDDGKYPSFVPVALAKHPQVDGTVVVQAGNRGLIITFCDGAHDDAAVRQQLSKGKPDQYRIAVDALVHRLVLWRHESVGEYAENDSADPLSLLSWLASTEQGRPFAQVLIAALEDFLGNPERVKAVGKALPAESDAFECADAMFTSLSMAVAHRKAQASVGEVKRR